MFDIGVWEMAVIAVVMLLVVGPQELPSLLRNIGQFISKAKRYLSEIKGDLDHELQKIDELKRKVAEQIDIADFHRQIDPTAPAVSVKKSVQTEDAEPVSDAKLDSDNGKTKTLSS